MILTLTEPTVTHMTRQRYDTDTYWAYSYPYDTTKPGHWRTYWAQCCPHRTSKTQHWHPLIAELSIYGTAKTRCWHPVSIIKSLTRHRHDTLTAWSRRYAYTYSLSVMLHTYINTPRQGCDADTNTERIVAHIAQQRHDTDTHQLSVNLNMQLGKGMMLILVNWEFYRQYGTERTWCWHSPLSVMLPLRHGKQDADTHPLNEILTIQHGKDLLLTFANRELSNPYGIANDMILTLTFERNVAHMTR